MAYLSAYKRFRVLSEHGFTCRYCGRKAPDVALEVDHIVPVQVGGSDDDDNLTAACVECNRGKSCQVLDETLLWCTDCCRQCMTQGDYTQHRPVSVNRNPDNKNWVRASYICLNGHQWRTGWGLKLAIEHALASRYDSQTRLK